RTPRPRNRRERFPRPRRRRKPDPSALQPASRPRRRQRPTPTKAERTSLPSRNRSSARSLSREGNPRTIGGAHTPPCARGCCRHLNAAQRVAFRSQAAAPGRYLLAAVAKDEVEVAVLLATNKRDRRRGIDAPLERQPDTPARPSRPA